MMTSRVLSRFLPVAEGDVSVFEGMRRTTHRQADVESLSGRHTDDQFHDDEEYPDRLFFEGANDDDTSEQAGRSPHLPHSSQSSPTLDRIRPKWLDDQRNRRIEEDEDVPESLLLDPKDEARLSRPTTQGEADTAAAIEAKWKAAQEEHQLHTASITRPAPKCGPRSHPTTNQPLTQQNDRRTEAMWLYTNANNLDAFLLEVYQYYVSHGVWSILLSRAIGLLTGAFIFSFFIFLTTCIDYSAIPNSKSTSDVIIPKCMAKASFGKNVAVFMFIMYWLTRAASHVRDTRRLFRMHNFFLHVLGISDQDLQTVSWVRVVDGLAKVQNANIATADLTKPNVKAFLKYGKAPQRINAESIANRLMRQDNYYVALYNKDILDFTLPLPFVGTRQFYSKSLEWCIDFCLTNFIFDEQGSIRPFCLEVRNRKALVTALRRRLQFAALTSVLIAPFNILRFCTLYFFTYYTEFTKNPSRISARTFTPFAEWKIREFNELDHLFQRRLRQAYPFANDYLKQFPKDRTDQICRFVALVSGAIAAVLTILSLWDPELFLGFEVTPGRTALFWLTVMIGIFTAAHGALPDENEVHDPVLHLKEVLMFTHYMPAHWKDRLHSNEVRAEFSAMYQMKILIFTEEILSLIVAPWILLRNATHRCERVVDFFREQTVHVDGIGYQCNFAVFGFKKDLNAEDPTAVLNEPDGLRDDYFGLKDDKMAASVSNFMQYYSHYNRNANLRRMVGWQPPPAWPPMLAQDAIAEEEGVPAHIARSTAAVRPSSGRRSGILDAKRRNSPLSVRSPPRVGRPVNARDRPSKTEQSQDVHAKSGHAGHDVSASRLIAQDSDLHDVVLSAGKDTMDSDTDDDAITNGNAGVLGMLQQFAKAQTEKGTGVNI